MPTFTTHHRLAIATVLAIATLGVSAPAQARSNVSIEIGIQLPGRAVVYPAPVYLPQQPVYMQTRPIYVQPLPMYTQRQPVYVQPGPIFIRPQPVIAYPPAVGYYYQPAPRWHHGHKKQPRWHGSHEHRGHRD